MWFSKYLFIGIGGAFFSLFFFGFPAFARACTCYILIFYFPNCEPRRYLSRIISPKKQIFIFCSCSVAIRVAEHEKSMLRYFFHAEKLPGILLNCTLTFSGPSIRIFPPEANTQP